MLSSCKRKQLPAAQVKKHTVEQHERQLGETRALLGKNLHLYQVHQFKICAQLCVFAATASNQS